MSSLEQINASAGSGKTYTLTRRFLNLLHGALPQGGPSICALESFAAPGEAETPPYSLGGILAATFTNKAAAEMQARVIRELKQQALSPDTRHAADADFPLSPAEARLWMDVILRRFDAMNIRTIDSLLTLLVRVNALPLSLPPDFTPLFSLVDALLPLYDTLLDRVAAGDTQTEALFRKACRGLLYHNRASGLAAGHLLRERLVEIIRLHLAGEKLPSEQDGERAATILAALHRDMVESAEALGGILAEEELSIASHAATFLSRCRALLPMTIPTFSETYAAKSLDEWLLKASRGKASHDAFTAHADFLAAYTALKTYGKTLLSTLELMPLVLLARPLLEGLETMQQEEGLIPAERLCALALAAISGEGGVSDAFCRLGDTLTHLLFDEFQDTSTTQWQAILPLAVESLSRGGSLTYVGDVKQAIYGWRGGNAELFDAVARDETLTAMLAEGPERTTLPHNWRSAPAVVEFNNAVFSRLADSATSGAVASAMLSSKTPSGIINGAAELLGTAFAHSTQEVPAKNAGKEGLVRLTRLHGPNNAAVSQSVRETLHDLLVDDLLTRRSPGEIAILVRKNKEAGEIAEWLTEWCIPVVTEHSFSLGGHPLVTRLVDMLTFLEYPMDDAAFWSAISGPELMPFADSPDLPDFATLTEWLAALRDKPGSPPLYAVFRKDFPRVWNAYLAPFLDQAGLLSAYDMVRELIRHFALLERFPAQTPFIRRFAEVAHAAESAGHSSLSAFLDYWAESGGKERVPMPESMDAVRILSMHKAKGLEFPVVIIPYHHQADPTRQPLMAQELFDMPLLGYGQAGNAESARAAVEQLNLLYVAWTRPTEELHAFITSTPRASALASALDVLLHDLPFENDVYTSGAAPAETCPPSGHAVTTPEPCRPESCDKAPLPQEDSGEATDALPPARLMNWLPRLKIFRNPTDDAGFSERQRGLLAHACLEALTLTGDLASDTKRAVLQGLRAFPVPMPDPEAVQRDMESMLAWYASLPDAPLWMRHGTPEQPLMDTNGNIHRVDRLVDAPGTPLLAVEYKTGRPTPDHKAQVTRYLSLLAPALERTDANRAVGGVVVYLDQRECVTVPDPRAASGSKGATGGAS